MYSETCLKHFDQPQESEIKNEYKSGLAVDQIFKYIAVYKYCFTKYTTSVDVESKQEPAQKSTLPFQ